MVDDSIARQLERLSVLHGTGAITTEEFTQAKASVLRAAPARHQVGAAAPGRYGPPGAAPPAGGAPSGSGGARAGNRRRLIVLVAALVVVALAVAVGLVWSSGPDIRTVPLSGTALSVAVSPDGGTAYVTDGPVTSVDASTLSPSTLLDIDRPDIGGAGGVAVSADGSLHVCWNPSFSAPAGSESYITRSDLAGGNRIDGDTLRDVTACFDLFAGQDNRLYVDSAASVLVLDGANGQVTGQIGSFDDQAHGVAASPDGASLYIAVSEERQLAVADVTNRFRTVGVGFEPKRLACSPDGRTLFATDDEADVLHVFDTSAVAETAALQLPGSAGGSVAVSPDGATVYVTTTRATTMLDVESNSVIETFDAGGYDIAVSPDGSRAYVAGDSALHVIDTGRG